MVLSNYANYQGIVRQEGTTQAPTFYSSMTKEQLIKYSIVLFFVSLIALVLVPILGVEVKGSKRWIDLFFLPRFQPIEVLKPFLIVFLAAILCTEKTNIMVKYILTTLTISIISLLLIVQPDIGQTLLVVFSWSVLIFTSGINIFILLAFFCLAIILLSYLIIYVPKFDYIQGRIAHTGFRDKIKFNTVVRDVRFLPKEKKFVVVNTVVSGAYPPCIEHALEIHSKCIKHALKTH